MSDVLYDESRPKHYISLDLVNRSIEPIVHVVQTDDKIPIVVASITDSGKPWIIPEDVISIEMYLRKPSGNIFWSDYIGVDNSRTKVLFEIVQRATASVGKGSAVIKFTFSDGTISTSPFVLQVDTNPIAGYNPEMDGNPDADVISAIRRLDAWLTEAQEQINEIINHDKEDDKEIDQLQEDLKRLIAKTKEVDDQLTKALDDLGNVVSKKDEELEQKLQDLSIKLKETEDQLTKELEQLRSDTEKSDSEINKAISELRESLTNSISSLRSVMEENDSGINQRIDDLTDNMESLETELKNKDKEIEEKIQNEDKKLQTQINDLEQKYNDIPSMLVPAGSIIFSELPSLEDAEIGWMYNILDDFETTSDFKEGSGIMFPAGTNVYKTKDDLWDCMSGPAVLSVNGKTGNVKITAEDLNFNPEQIKTSIADLNKEITEVKKVSDENDEELKKETEDLNKRVSNLEESGGSVEIKVLKDQVNALIEAIKILSTHSILDSDCPGIIIPDFVENNDKT